MKPEKVVLVAKEEARNDETLITDPVEELKLGESAYKIEPHDMGDTKPQFKGLGINYYSVRGGEVTKKEFNEDRDAVIFNKDKPDEFEIGIATKKRTFGQSLDVWYANKALATGIAKELTGEEMKKVEKMQKDWAGASSFLETQMEQNQF